MKIWNLAGEFPVQLPHPVKAMPCPPCSAHPGQCDASDRQVRARLSALHLFLEAEGQKEEQGSRRGHGILFGIDGI